MWHGRRGCFLQGNTQMCGSVLFPCPSLTLGLPYPSLSFSLLQQSRCEKKRPRDATTRHTLTHNSGIFKGGERTSQGSGSEGKLPPPLTSFPTSPPSPRLTVAGGPASHGYGLNASGHWASFRNVLLWKLRSDQSNFRYSLASSAADQNQKYSTSFKHCYEPKKKITCGIIKISNRTSILSHSSYSLFYLGHH